MIWGVAYPTGAVGVCVCDKEAITQIEGLDREIISLKKKMITFPIKKAKKDDQLPKEK